MINSLFHMLLLMLSVTLITSCSAIKPKQPLKNAHRLTVTLNQYPQSAFKQVEATFFTQQSKDVVFRVLSDIDQTPQWLENAENLQVLDVYNNSHYLLRSIISSPWPFKKRELITCVKTDFTQTIITINIASCSERSPKDLKYVRVSQLTSNWSITQLNNGWTKVNYTAWLDPNGYVPAIFFNNALNQKTISSMKKLQLIIEKTTLSDYYY